MVNLIRTLLLNLRAEDQPSFFSEFVPPEFTPVKRQGVLKSVEDIIFGIDPDPEMRAIRTSQMLQIIETTELSEHLTSIDRRITYQNSEIPPDVFKIKVTRINGTEAVTGNYPNPSYSGVSTFHYRVTFESPMVIVSRLSNPVSSETSQIVDLFKGDLYQVPLVFSDLTFSFQLVDISNKSWDIKKITPPKRQWLDVEKELKKMSPSLESNLFLDGNPSQIFRDVWLSHPYANYRLSGLFLGMAYLAREMSTQ